MTGLTRRNIAIELRDHALRKVVCLDLVVDGKGLERRHQSPVAADYALDHPVVAEMIEATFFAIALPCGVDEGEIARVPHTVRVVLGACDETRFERDRDTFGKSDPHKATGGDRVAACHERDRGPRGYDLALLEAS